MRYSIWSKIGSYFIDILLEKQESVYSGTLELIQRKGRLALCTENAVYSYEDLYSNFRDSFKQMNWSSLKGNKVLVLGMGMGSIPQLLEQQFGNHFRYTLVELDEVVVALAQKYTLPKLQSDYNVVTANAVDFVANDTQQYDIIAVDLFVDDQTPAIFEQTEFLENCKKRLHPEGVLIYNRLTYSEILKEKTDFFYKRCFQPVFIKSVILTLDGNKMLFSRSILK